MNCGARYESVPEILYCGKCGSALASPAPQTPDNSQYKSERHELSNGNLFKGQLLVGLPQGEGILTVLDGWCFESYTEYSGFFIDGQLAEGKATTRRNDNAAVIFEYTGELKDLKPHGFGRWQFDKIRFYEGEFKHQRKHGKGTFVDVDYSYYVGEFVENKRHGQGKEVYPPIPGGGSYEGEFKNDKRHGRGILVFENGSSYEGEFKDDYMNGYGIYKIDNKMKFEGQFTIEKRPYREGRANYWIIFDKSGRRFEGRFHDDGTFENHTSIMQKLRNKF